MYIFGQKTSVKYSNPRPGITPAWVQDALFEIEGRDNTYNISVKQWNK